MRWRSVRSLLFFPRRRGRTTRPLRKRITQPLSPLASRVSGWAEFCQRMHFSDGCWPLIAGDMEEILENEPPPVFTVEMLVARKWEIDEFSDTLPASYAFWDGKWYEDDAQRWYEADTQKNASQ